MTNAEIDTNIISPFVIPDFPPGSHVYDPRKENLIDGINKDMIDPLRAQADFWEYQESIGVHDEVYTDGSKVNERVWAAAAVRRHFQNGETTERHFLKRLPDGSSIFAAEATAIEMALEYYSVMPAVGHDVVVYSDSMSCLQAIDGEDTEQPFICRIMNLLWRLHDKGTNVRFCWLPSHRGIEGNEVADRLAREALDQDATAKGTLLGSETHGEHLHPGACADQVGCVCPWQRHVLIETNPWATKEIQVPY